MPSTAIERRAFLRGAAATALALCGPLSVRPGVAAGASPLYLSACRRPDGGYAIAAFDPEGAVLRTLPLPDRGHAVALAPDGGLAIAFARHPRDFAVAFSPRGAEEPVLFRTAPGRHFYGHGAFAADGRLLYATENDYAAARGVIGVYDVAGGFRRVGEFASGGVGPHELLLLPGDLLAVANGGIETHPDAGDAKLNLATMAPSLALIDLRQGDLRARYHLPAGLHQLSIRHMAADAAGSLWFGCQYEGTAEDRPPLVGRLAPESGLSLIADPEPVRLTLANYIGSVAAGRDGTVIAASSPRGGRIVFFAADGRFLGVRDLADGCGLAPATGDAFIATAGGGEIERLAPSAAARLARADLAFDNHLAVLAP